MLIWLFTDGLTPEPHSTVHPSIIRTSKQYFIATANRLAISANIAYKAWCYRIKSPVSTKQYRSVQLGMVSILFVFPLSKAVNCSLKKQTTPWPFCHPSHGVPTWAKLYYKGEVRPIAVHWVVDRTVTSLWQLFSPHGIKLFLRRSLSNLCHKQLYVDRKQHKMLNILHCFLGLLLQFHCWLK